MCVCVGGGGGGGVKAIFRAEGHFQLISSSINKIHRNVA